VPIDPITAAAAANLISDALEAAARLLSRHQRDTKERKIKIHLNDGAELANRLNLAIVASEPMPNVAFARLRAFFNGPEFTVITRQLSMAVLAEQLPTYKDNIIDEMSLLLAVNPEFDELVATRIARRCVDALAETLESIARSRLARAGLKVRATDELLLTHLRNIDRQLQEIGSAHLPDLASLQHFTTELRRQIRQRHGRITPPNLRDVRRIPIDTIYVAARLSPFTHQSKGEATEAQEALPRSADIALAKMASLAYRDVILGSPGSGKTTLITKLCYELAGESENFNVGGRRPVPLPVTLRNLTAERTQGDISIVRHIEAYITNRLQLTVPSGVIDYLLITGRAIVLFDGLDELTDTALRRQTTEDVESFCSLYGQAPVIVTSREVGYDEAPLDYASFSVWQLSDFDESQTKEYACKWFAAASNVSRSELDETVASFMADTEDIQDLRSNALLLALLCNLYLGSHYIPRYRPEVYESCANMLFERWDNSRGIRVPRLFESNRSGLLTFLAHWIYSTEGLPEGVPESDLVRATADYLYGRRYRLREDAETAARSLVSYCSGRAWVFTDTGTTGSGERLYQFTHRTFMEYFAASYVVRVNMTPDRVWDTLRAQVAGGSYDAVSLLTVQILQRTAEDGAERLLRLLLAQAEVSDSQARTHLLRFSAFCLVRIMLAPELVDALASYMLKTFLAEISATDKIELESLEYFLLDTLFLVLGYMNIERDNQVVILEALQRLVSLDLDASQDGCLSAAGRLGLGLIRWYTFCWDDDEAWAAFDRLVVGQMSQEDSRAVARLARVIRQYERGLITYFECFGEAAEICLRPVRVTGIDFSR
jgi:NACHT domain